MDQLFAFVGQYWWLAFPLFGVLAGAGRAWERGARMRHKRRLEVIHAKAELRAAKTGAVPEAREVAAAAAAPAGTPLERVMATHDEVTRRWLDYELDVAKIIAFPAMSDGRQPLTAAFLRAKKVADGLRPASTKARVAKEQLAEYRAAVTDYEVAFDLAEREARRIRDSSFTEAERKRLDTAKQLLSVAIDQAATPAERQLAYRRVREELDGLLALSDEAIEVLEVKVALELPAAPTTASTPTASTPDAAPTTAPPPVPTTTPPPAPTAIPTTAPGRVVRPRPRA